MLRSARNRLVTLLGSKCSCENPDCCHEGPCCVSDERCIQVDHVNGDGKAERKRFSSSEAMFRYYLENFEEIKPRIQLLCANCNRVKSIRDDEIRQAAPYGDIVERIEGLDNYNTLLVFFRSVASSVVSADELTLLTEMRRDGLAESTNHPLSYFLSRNWAQQDFYGEDADDLVAFLKEKELLLRSVIKRLAIRVDGKRH